MREVNVKVGWWVYKFDYECEEASEQVGMGVLSQKEVITDSFLLNQPMYDMTPPAPLPFPKQFYYSLDPTRHYHHRFSPAFIAHTKPLLVPNDLGLPVDHLLLFAKHYNQQSQVLPLPRRARSTQKTRRLSRRRLWTRRQRRRSDRLYLLLREWHY